MQPDQLKIQSVIKYAFLKSKKHTSKLFLFFLGMGFIDLFFSWLIHIFGQKIFSNIWPNKILYMLLLILISFIYFLFYAIVFFQLFRYTIDSKKNLLKLIKTLPPKLFFKYLKAVIIFILFLMLTFFVTFIVLSVIAIIVKISIGFLSPKFLFYSVSAASILVFIPLFPIFSRLFYFSYFILDQKENKSAFKSIKSSFKMTYSKTFFSLSFISLSLMPIFIFAFFIIYLELRGFPIQFYISCLFNFILSYITIPFLNFGTFYIYKNFKKLT